MSLRKIEAFFANHIEAVLGALVAMLFIFLICLCAIPVTETMTVDKIRWSWDIPIYVYTVHNEESWDSPPSDAYDISKEWSYHYSRTVKTGEWVDSEGLTHDIPYNVSSPKIGDQKRSAHKEHYDIYGVIDCKAVCYHVTESDWKKIDVGGSITYSRHRFGDKIWNIRFE